MNCGAHIVKYILFLFNFLCLVAGILLIIFGSLVLTNNESVLQIPDSEVLGQFPKGIPIAAIVLGSIIFLISFLGCCGACKENNCMTLLYSICMLILLALQIAFIVVVWVKQGDIINIINQSMEDAWNIVTQKSDVNYLSVYQSALKCCGKLGPSDYIGAGLQIPQSCCDSSATICTEQTAFQTGCEKAFDDWWQLNLNLVKYVGIGIAAID
uniref:Tetraspanin n=1 Tax=Megaselia scalaris TaxID=36166 RepID=T1GNT4_MEGSC